MSGFFKSLVRKPAGSIDIERALPAFRRGLNDGYVRESDLVDLLGDALNLSPYNRLQLLAMKPRVDKTYKENITFWKDVLKGTLIQGMRVCLRGFHIMEWIPSAPGRYFTSGARVARRRAAGFVSSSRREYLPLGKYGMILGGVGSIRLGSRVVTSHQVYPLGASSNGISHQGIPVILPEREYHKVMPFLQEYGGCLVSLIGRLQVFPTRELLIQYSKQMSRYSIFVETVEVVRPSEKLLVSVAITFSEAGGVTKNWAYCSFDPTQQQVRDAFEPEFWSRAPLPPQEAANWGMIFPYRQTIRGKPSVRPNI